MRDEVKTSDVILFGSFTCGLFVSGIVSPWVGRRIDAHGGRGVLAGGALLGRLAQPQFIAKAIAPLALTLIFTVDASRNASLWVLVACGAIALYAYQRAVSAARAGASKPLR
jgi:hypothetical protein